MADSFIVLDSGAIQNIFAGGGEAAWDHFLAGGNKVIVSSVILEELAGAPGELREKFGTWMTRRQVATVEFELPGLRRPDHSLRNDAGDNVLRALMDHQNNPAAAAALQHAGIDTRGSFRLLSDDAGFLRKVYVETGSFSSDGLSGKGHGVEPYRSGRWVHPRQSRRIQRHSLATLRRKTSCIGYVGQGRPF